MEFDDEIEGPVSAHDPIDTADLATATLAELTILDQTEEIRVLHDYGKRLVVDDTGEFGG